MKKVSIYFNDDTYDFLNKTKANLILDGYTKTSLSKLIRIAVNELKHETNYADIKHIMNKELL